MHGKVQALRPPEDIPGEGSYQSPRWMSCSKRVDSHSIRPAKNLKLPAFSSPAAISLPACTSPTH